MGSKNKLKRFRENEIFSNVLQPSREEVLKGFANKGKWNDFFEKPNPIVLELGCGKGEYTVSLAAKNPNKNHIGIDIKGARFWAGARDALDAQLKNVCFLRTQIELINFVFDDHEVDEIWITFPDPQIKYTRTKHRLTNIDFLTKYQKIIKKGGFLYLKTDSEFMHGYTLGLLKGLNCDIIEAHHDIYKNPHVPQEITAVQTFYEKKYLKIEKPITYIKFCLDNL
jgi:tRNA (guanine-N7-)-methyltransferase